MKVKGLHSDLSKNFSPSPRPQDGSLHSHKGPNVHPSPIFKELHYSFQCNWRTPYKAYPSPILKELHCSFQCNWRAPYKHIFLLLFVGHFILQNAPQKYEMKNGHKSLCSIQPSAISILKIKPIVSFHKPFSQLCPWPLA